MKYAHRRKEFKAPTVAGQEPDLSSVPVTKIPGIERVMDKPPEPILDGFEAMGIGHYLRTSYDAHAVLSAAQEGADVPPERIDQALRVTGDLT